MINQLAKCNGPIKQGPEKDSLGAVHISIHDDVACVAAIHLRSTQIVFDVAACAAGFTCVGFRDERHFLPVLLSLRDERPLNLECPHVSMLRTVRLLILRFFRRDMAPPSNFGMMIISKARTSHNAAFLEPHSQDFLFDDACAPGPCAWSYASEPVLLMSWSRDRRVNGRSIFLMIYGD